MSPSQATSHDRLASLALYSLRFEVPKKRRQRTAPTPSRLLNEHAGAFVESESSSATGDELGSSDSAECSIYAVGAADVVSSIARVYPGTDDESRDSFYDREHEDRIALQPQRRQVTKRFHDASGCSDNSEDSRVEYDSSAVVETGRVGERDRDVVGRPSAGDEFSFGISFVHADSDIGSVQITHRETMLRSGRDATNDQLVKKMATAASSRALSSRSGRDTSRDQRVRKRPTTANSRALSSRSGRDTLSDQRTENKAAIMNSRALSLRLARNALRDQLTEKRAATASSSASSSSSLPNLDSLRRYPCPFAGCLSAFTKSSNLTAHVRTHTNERPFWCKFKGCKSAFAQRSNLTLHMRTHTNERPFACTFEGCSSAFARRSTLNLHLRTHTKERPFACTVEGCPSTFVQRAHLKTHMRVHRND